MTHVSKAAASVVAGFTASAYGDPPPFLFHTHPRGESCRPSCAPLTVSVARTPVIMWWACDPCPRWHRLPLIRRLLHSELP